MPFDITAYILSKEFTAVTVKSAVDKQAGQTVELVDSSGTLNQETLDTLNNSISNTIILDHKVYRLNSITNELYKYICTVTDRTDGVISMTELRINKTTGDFETKQLIVDQSPVTELRHEFEEHLADMEAHITQAERDNWNNKVSAEAELMDTKNNHKLKLING